MLNKLQSAQTLFVNNFKQLYYNSTKEDLKVYFYVMCLDFNVT